jgi:hypothetical protein
VLTIPGRIAAAEHEWLRAVGGPVGFGVELARVPDDLQYISVVGKGKGEGTYFEHELRDLDGVCGGAVAADTGAGEGGGACFGVGDVGLVVRAVEVHAVPATTYKLA